VSFPIGWDELGARLRPAAFTLARVRDGAARGGDAWTDYWTTRQRLPVLSRQS
jgi:DNA primase